MGGFHTFRHTRTSGLRGSTNAKMGRQCLFVICLLAITSLCCGHIGGRQASQNSDVQFYCGRNLARTLAALCYGLSQENLIAGKRSEDGDTLIFPYYKNQEPREKDYGWPWLAPHKARSMGLPSRGKRLIANECCDKPCSLNELMSYC